MTAFYTPVRPGVLASTEHTVGPWSPTGSRAARPGSQRRGTNGGGFALSTLSDSAGEVGRGAAQALLVRPR